jgi:AcrR family transcriptional regulator
MDAFRLATRKFVACERIDMRALAKELGVSRGTLYRWVGDKERLLGEVISELARKTFENAVRDISSKGVDLIADMTVLSLRQIQTFKPMQTLIARDAQYALRVLTTSESRVHQNAVEFNQRLLEQEAAAGHLKLPGDPADLSYVIVRISEAFLYSETIIGREPDVEKVGEMIRLLLRD